MTRYVTRAWIDDDAPFENRERPPAITVHEADGPIDTGLVDAHGVRIYRIADRVPMGFRNK